MVPFEKQVVTVIRQGKAGTDTTDKPPLRAGFGISDKTVEGANAATGRTILVPGAGSNPAHITPQRRVLAHHIRQDLADSAKERPH
jgi:hypothetical protein